MSSLSSFLRAVLGTAAFALFFQTSTRALAAEQRLSDLSYVSHQIDQGAFVIQTSGTAKLRITFAFPDTARIQIFPTGSIVQNPSPAISGTPVSVAGTTVIDQDDTLLIQNTGLTLRIDKKHLRVDAYDGSNSNAISLENSDDGTVWDAESGSIRHSRVLNDAEHLYGLGQDNSNHGKLDRRGTIRDMWTGQQIRSGNVTADYPVPFYLSTGVDGRGYGCFVDNVWHMHFDLGKTHHDRLTWTAPGGPIDYYLINGPSFKSIINQYTQLTGRPSMLPLWALGFWQSRCFYQSFPEIKGAADRIQKDGLPLDVMVIDSAWSKHDMDFLFSDKFLRGRKLDEWTSDFHAAGLKTILSTKGPMINPDAENYADAMSRGLFATDGKGKPMAAGYYGGHLMDFTHPDMQSWITGQLKPLTQAGIDGWWLDLIEPEGEPPQAVYHEGKSADIHNTYPLLNYRTYFNYCLDVQPDLRPVILGRAATAGTQRYSAIVWTGDINSDWPTFRAHIPEAQNTGLSGLPYWTNDSGGFISGFLNHDRYGAHAELYERWFEFTCFAPIARAHKAGPSEPYEFGPVVEATAKKYLQLRYRLMPYIYSLMHEATVSGLPMLRPLILEYQNDPASATAKTEYLFGSDLLIAPIIWANTFSRDVYFPPGKWISYDEGFEVDGGTTIGVAAPHDRLPLFVRAGAILPNAPEMVSTGEKPWDPITLDIWPEGESTGSLYQDDTSTMAFTKGESTTTLFHCVEQPGKAVSFKIEPSNGKFGPKQWITKFHLTSVPVAVAVDDKPLSAAEWSFDAATNTLTVNLAGEHAAHALAINLDGSSHSRPSSPKVEVVPPNENAVAATKQTAQFLPPPRLPIRIEAANFDKGGEGLAFHIAKPSTTAVYRQDGVPIINSTDSGGGYALPQLNKDEWVAYTIDAVDGGWFAVSARVHPTAESAITLLRNRTIKLTTIEMPASAQEWTSVAGKTLFYLPPGEQIITAEASKPGFDLANFTFTKVKETGTAAEAEAGVLTGVKVESDHPGYTGTGFAAAIGSQGTGVKISIKAPSAGSYLVVIRYANGANDATLDVIPNGGTSTSAILQLLPSWEDYGETAVPLELKAGDNEIQINGTDKGLVNIDQIRLILTDAPTTAPSTPSAGADALINHFLPTPVVGKITNDAWGAKNVLPRDPQNGLEDTTMKQWCYWDGQIIKAPDGKYHMFASRWDQAKGHNGWWGSVAVHAVSDNVLGPYIDKGPLWPDNQGGKGHNVTALVLPDGTYAVVVSETRPGDVFVSKSLDGPWEFKGSIQVVDNEFKKFGRMSNVSVMVRPDGNFEIVARSGAIWISKTGILGPYTVQGKSVYPQVAGLPLENLEDPVIWFSGGSYHIVVNSWSGRKAYHITSADGINDWKFQGLAYDPTADFVRYTDGTINHWDKIERPGVLIENGKVTHFTFAVLDVPKDQEKPNDNHGSKVIVVPFDGAAFDHDR